MGQKVNPHGLRVGVIKDWDSRWYARDDKVGDLIVEDYNIRKYLKSTLYAAGIPKIEIERDSAKVRVYIHCSRPGVVIGKGGTEIERIRKDLEKRIGKTVMLSIVEVKTPDTNAQLVAENIAQQLEKRIGFRRAMKNAMGRAMRMGVRGIKVMCGGRLGGAEIAGSETYHEGTIPLQTLRADIEYEMCIRDRVNVNEIGRTAVDFRAFRLVCLQVKGKFAVDRDQNGAVKFCGGVHVLRRVFLLGGVRIAVINLHGRDDLIVTLNAVGSAPIVYAVRAVCTAGTVCGRGILRGDGTGAARGLRRRSVVGYRTGPR